MDTTAIQQVYGGDLSRTARLKFYHWIDWPLFFAVLLLVAAGLVTMNSFIGENYFFEKQLIWAVSGIAIFFILSFVDFRFLRRTGVIVALFIFSIILLLLLFVFGDFVKGAQSKFNF
jgi:rod shape determining protein RodA